MSDADILINVMPDFIKDEDDDVIEDLDFLPPLTRPSKRDFEGALDKLQDFSFFSSYGNQTQPLTLKIGPFLNKERTKSLKQSHVTDFFQ